MPGSSLPWILFKVAAKATTKGAAVTVTSTVFSVTLACYIEMGAHRMVYRFFPYRYANVEHANGLTQDQLEAVRVHKIPHTGSLPDEERDFQDTTASSSSEEESPSMNMQTSSGSTYRPTDKFWREVSEISGEVRRNDVTESVQRLENRVFRSQEILACAMTG